MAGRDNGDGSPGPGSRIDRRGLLGGTAAGLVGAGAGCLGSLTGGGGDTCPPGETAVSAIADDGGEYVGETVGVRGTVEGFGLSEDRPGDRNRAYYREDFRLENDGGTVTVEPTEEYETRLPSMEFGTCLRVEGTVVEEVPGLHVIAEATWTEE